MGLTFEDLLVDDKAPVVVGLPVDAETLVVVGGLFVVRLAESLVDLLVDAEPPDVVGLRVDAVAGIHSSGNRSSVTLRQREKKN